MTVTFRHATEADTEPIASLLTELGYASTAADVVDRVRRSLHSRTSWLLLAQSENDVIGLIAAELVPYFPNGSTVCRVTALVVGTRHRRLGLGEKLLARVIDFAREHGCSGIELTSAHHRLDAHRFCERLGFSRASLRFFRSL
jgi:N-acetylglutamate synthase-like GNAT family acetyltransferase